MASKRDKQIGQLAGLVSRSSVSSSPSSSPRSSADSMAEATDDSMEISPSVCDKTAKLVGQAARGQTNGCSSSSSSSGSSNNNIAKSPILVKYNYYDYNGERQENHELLLLAAAHKQGAAAAAAALASQKSSVQRQLSPTFRQNLDQILVRSRLSQVAENGSAPSSGRSSAASSEPQQQQLLQAASARASPLSPLVPPPPPPQQQQQSAAHFASGTMLLARRYARSSYEHRCLRCRKTVYQMDKVGPLKEFSFYHQNCFKCLECGLKLTLKTYYNNQHSSTDLEVYCHRHCPRSPAGRLDNQSVGIRTALNAPKVFELPLGAAWLSAGPLGCDEDDQQQQQQQQQLLANSTSVDSRALHIQHAMRQTKLQAIYKRSRVDQKISQMLNRRLEYLEPKQKKLEMRHREEEEQLFRAFELKWRQEEQQIREQIRDEWQLELQKLFEKYKRQLSTLSSSTKGGRPGAAELLQASASGPANQSAVGLQADSLAREQQQQQVASSIAAAAAAAARAAKQQQQQQQQQAHSKAQAHAQQQQQQLMQATNNNKNKQTPADIKRGQLMNGNGQITNNKLEHDERLIELERMNLEKTMTIKLDKKKETLKRRLREFERQATAELVEKQSCEMLALISMKLEEFKEEQKVSAPLFASLSLSFAYAKLAQREQPRLKTSSTRFPPPPPPPLLGFHLPLTASPTKAVFFYEQQKASFDCIVVALFMRPPQCANDEFCTGAAKRAKRALGLADAKLGSIENCTPAAAAATAPSPQLEAQIDTAPPTATCDQPRRH